ncbi:MAG: hypothetical protein WC718_04750 [Phycisphaerales bacterium]|jgi:MprA protease rhombosortase-interaction domain-containing protein
MRTQITAAIAAAVTVGLASAAFGQVVIVNDMAGTFVDISTTGTPLNLTDDGQVTINSGIISAFFGTNVVTVSNNMAVGFGNFAAANTAGPVNTPIPSPALFGGGQSVAVLWDNPGPGTGGLSNVFYQEFADSYVIQWNMLPKGDSGSTATMELQVFGGAARRDNVFAQFLYADVEQSGVRNVGTIGYQSGIDTQRNSVQYAFNDVEAIQNGTVLTLTLAPSPGALLVFAGVLPFARRRR